MPCGLMPALLQARRVASLRSTIGTTLLYRRSSAFFRCCLRSSYCSEAPVTPCLRHVHIDIFDLDQH